jgi:nitrite reductase [NAD(P)H] small subunit
MDTLKQSMPPRIWTDIGAAEAIPRLGARRYRLGGEMIAVFRTAADEYFALADRCPHRGGPLSEGIVAGRTVACPLHGWVIALDGGGAIAPDEGCTPTLPLRIVEGRVHLSIGGSEA